MAVKADSIKLQVAAGQLLGFPFLFDVYVDILELHDEDDEAGKRRVFA